MIPSSSSLALFGFCTNSLTSENNLYSELKMSPLICATFFLLTSSKVSMLLAKAISWIRPSLLPLTFTPHCSSSSCLALLHYQFMPPDRIPSSNIQHASHLENNNNKNPLWFALPPSAVSSFFCSSVEPTSLKELIILSITNRSLSILF